MRSSTWTERRSNAARNCSQRRTNLRLVQKQRRAQSFHPACCSSSHALLPCSPRLASCGELSQVRETLSHGSPMRLWSAEPWRESLRLSVVSYVLGALGGFLAARPFQDRSLSGMRIPAPVVRRDKCENRPWPPADHRVNERTRGCQVGLTEQRPGLQGAGSHPRACSCWVRSSGH
jgi:hypothetical protein